MTNERLSAWIDGEQDDCAGPAPADGPSREACAAWWLVGDVMRRESPLSPDFTARVMQALEAEPTVLAPRRQMSPPARVVPQWMSAAAAVAGVVVVAWLAGGRSAPERAPAVAAESAPTAAQLVLVRESARESLADADDRRAYLLAHQAFGPGVQMAGVSGYVRPVSFDQSLVASR